MRVLLTLVFVALTAAANFAGWWWFNRPVPVPLSYDEPFPSVSFAPFRRGQSPISGDYPPPSQIEEDLKSLVGVTRGIRTYTSREGLDVVPGLARKYGIEVTHSAWLGAKTAINDQEVRALIEAAHAHPDVIKRVIVGNEVLLRQDLTADQLAGYIRRVKQSVKQPVSYADVWAFWLKNPQLAAEVDFITIHILPYWEDEPVGVEGAAEHIVKIYRMVQQAFPGKPILIGEAGWPTRGRNRGPAAVNMENAAFFVRTLAQVSKANGFDYNVVEAFDQPWKAKLEGSVGAKWGVVDEFRQVKYRMSGPVEPNPDWLRHGLAAAAMGALATFWAMRRRGPFTPKAAFALAGLAQVLAACVLWQALNAVWLAYDLPSALWAFTRIALHIAFALVILRTAARSFAGGEPAASRWGERMLGFYAGAAVVSTLLLFFVGRYRDIPNLEFLVPVVGVSAFALARMAIHGLPAVKAFAAGRLFSGGEREGGFGPAAQVTKALLFAAALAPLSESLALYLGEDFQAMHPDLSQQVPLMAEIAAANGEMLVWSLMLLMLAIPFAAEWKRRR